MFLASLSLIQKESCPFAEWGSEGFSLANSCFSRVVHFSASELVLVVSKCAYL